MQRENGSYDCGLFVIADATTLCNGVDSTNVIFKQNAHTLNKVI